MDIALLIISGGLVGVAIGLTGVGGGSLMTPLLLLFGYPAPVAIGTDLLYAAITKGGGMMFHHGKGNVRWKTMILLSAGSIPVSLLINFLVFDDSFFQSEGFTRVLTVFLGIMLILTSLVILFQGKIQRRLNGNSGISTADLTKPPSFGFARRHTAIMTLLLGMVLGVCVTLSSVGAGAFGAAILFLLYPALKARVIIGTDIAHAVPLTLVAGLGYLYNGLVDLTLLLCLIIGSLPGIYIGTHMGSKLPDKLMRSLLVLILLSLGIYFSISSGH